MLIYKRMLQCMCILHEVFAHDYVLSSTPHSPFPFTLSISSLVRRSPSPSGAPPSSLPLADRFLSPPPSVREFSFFLTQTVSTKLPLHFLLYLSKFQFGNSWVSPKQFTKLSCIPKKNGYLLQFDWDFMSESLFICFELMNSAVVS